MATILPRPRGSGMFTCATCGVTVKRSNSHVRGKQFFCSRACRLTPLESRVCVWCGATFHVRPLLKRTYCSDRCYHTRTQGDLRALIARRSVPTVTGCWIWAGSWGWPDGGVQPYGRIKIRDAQDYAHRVSYRAFAGPIPTGATIDHLCFNTLCVNPAHLEAVTQAENSRRYMLDKHWPARRQEVAHG